MMNPVMENMSGDLFVILNAVVSFFTYLVIHFLTFRLINSRAVLKWLVNVFLVGAFFNAGGTVVYAFVVTDAMRRVGVVGVCVYGIASFAIYGFLTFLYVLCVFGIHESSIRVRMLRELYAVHPTPLSLADLLGRYNAQTILKKRLERLTASGEIIPDGALYRIQNQSNFFLFKEFITRKILKIMGNEQGS